jgi:hypothetical protein
MMSRLRLIDGVTHVTLAESSKTDQASAGGASATVGGNDDDCRYNDAIARFDVLILFNAPPAAAAPAVTAAPATGAPADGAVAPVSTTTTTPSGSTK